MLLPVPIQISRAPKTVAPNQKAIDDLPLNSGTWRVEGIPGLYVRCRVRSKSFFLQRRIHGRLVKVTLGQLPLKLARAEALRLWAKLRPVPPGGQKTFGEAFQEFLEQRDLAPKTRFLYEYSFRRYLAHWRDSSLSELGNDRSGVRALIHSIAREHGKATARQVIQLVSAVYRYARKADPELPECPTIAVEMPKIAPRDWALSAEELRGWWAAVRDLTPVKRMWWLTCLLTGARRGSIEALKWEDVQFDRRTIQFRVTKGNRPYVVPAADRLLHLLRLYQDSGAIAPSEWVFPSPTKAGYHLINVRDDKRGVASAHHLRHTFRTVLAELGATPDQARLLMGHSLGGDVSLGYITAPLVVESLRPLVNAVAEHYARILEWP